MWLNGMAESRRHQGRFGRMLKCSRSVANPTQVLPCVITEKVFFGRASCRPPPARSQAFPRLGITGDSWKPEGEASPFNAVRARANGRSDVSWGLGPVSVATNGWVHGPKPMPRLLRRSFFDRSVHVVAPELIGATLLIDGTGGVIVEVEAYHHTDPAAHSYKGRTERNAVMFGPAGYAYVYRSYGIHWCLNFVCEEDGSASAVLIRAVKPTEGIAVMRRRRALREERDLCSGPGKLCEALGVTRRHNGLPLDRAPF